MQNLMDKQQEQPNKVMDEKGVAAMFADALLNVTHNDLAAAVDIAQLTLAALSFVVLSKGGKSNA